MAKDGMRIIYGLIISAAVSMPVVSAATLVGVNFGGSTSPSPTHWTLMSAEGTLNNLMDSTGAPTAISITTSATPTPPIAFGPLTGVLVTSTIPSDAPSFANLESNFDTSGGTNNALTAQFSGLTPNATYSVYAIGLRFSGAMNQSVTVTGSGAPVMFNQAGAVDSLFINGSIGSSSRTLESYALSIPATGSGTITIRFAGVSPSRYTVGGLALSSTPSIPASPAPSSLLLVLVGLAMVGGVYLVRRRYQAAL
jgi:hypothetical protein